MNKFKVKFLEPALDDLEEIVLYISRNSTQNALKMHDQIISQSKKLEKFPKLGAKIPDKKMSLRGYRMLIISPYIVFYRVIDENIFIYRVLHGSTNYPMLYDSMQ